MIDIKLIRENPELVKENIKKKFQDEKLPLVDEVFELDKKVREVKQMEILHTDHGAMIPEILYTSAEKKTGLDNIKATLGIK